MNLTSFAVCSIGLTGRFILPGAPLQQLEVLNKAAEYVRRQRRRRHALCVMSRRWKGAYDICCNSDLLSKAEVNDLHFFPCHTKHHLKKTYQGHAPDAVRMNKRVAEMLKDALVSDTVEEIAKIGVASDEEIDLLSSDYMKRINQIPYKNTKVKLMEQLSKQVIESLRKVNKQKGVDFTKRLEDIVKKYNDRSDDAALANDVIDDVVGEMVKLMEEVAGERSSGDDIGLSLAEKAFFDILKAVAVKYDFVENFPDEKLTELAKAIKTMVEEQSDVEDWLNRTDLRATLKMNVIVLLARAGYPPKIRDEVYKEIQNRQKTSNVTLHLAHTLHFPMTQSQ